MKMTLNRRTKAQMKTAMRMKRTEQMTMMNLMTRCRQNQTVKLHKTKKTAMRRVRTPAKRSNRQKAQIKNPKRTITSH
jgi:hypothetical protein